MKLITAKKKTYKVFLRSGTVLIFYSGVSLIMYLSNINSEAQQN